MYILPYRPQASASSEYTDWVADLCRRGIGLAGKSYSLHDELVVEDPEVAKNIMEELMKRCASNLTTGRTSCNKPNGASNEAE